MPEAKRPLLGLARDLLISCNAALLEISMFNTWKDGLCLVETWMRNSFKGEETQIFNFSGNHDIAFFPASIQMDVISI